jgi:BolA protein
VIVVSDQFEKMPLIARHRMINDLLAHELENGVHALSLQTKTVSQWEDIGGKVPATPPCQFKK